MPLTPAAGFVIRWLMTRQLSRRGFVKSSLIATAAVPLALRGQTSSTPATPAATRAPVATAGEQIPMGKIGDQEFSRLMMGGNLIGGWSHSRDLDYVSAPMRHYNTDAKITETLEIGEAHGITVINTW